MKIEEFKSMGWSDMHPMQVEAVMNMMSSAIGLAECTKDPEIMEAITQEADELVRLFGGNALTVDYKTQEMDLDV